MDMSSTKTQADRIGELDAMMAPMQAERDQLAAIIKSAGPGTYEGLLWTAVVSASERESVDWKAVAGKLQPSRQLVTAHTKTTPVVVLKIRGTK